MKRLLHTICFNLLLAGIFYSQETGKDVKHDQITGLIADVLFDSRAKPVRQALTAFEIKNGIKLQFRVEDSSLDQLGGLSEHLFRLFQNFTTLQNTNVKTITGQFGVQEKDRPAPVLAYNSKVTPDLSPCILPREDTGRMDSLYNRFLSGAPMGDIENIEMMPSGLDGIYGDAAYHYAKILHKNVNCPGIFDANLYNQHVNATRQNRVSNWAGDIAAISVNLSA